MPCMEADLQPSESFTVKDAVLQVTVRDDVGLCRGQAGGDV